MTKNKQFYTGNVAYTTPSGRMHLGHGLGHVITDATIRFNCLRDGKKPFFGFGIHSTGKDLIKIVKKIEEGVDLERYNISQEERGQILSQKDLYAQVDALVNIYRKQYSAVISKLGSTSDLETFFSSHQAENHKFTQWTLRKLKEAGLIVETTANRYFCPDCNDIKAIEKDLCEVSTTSKVDFEKVRIQETSTEEGKKLEIVGGEFYCRLHGNTRIIAKETTENAIDYGNRKVQDRAITLSKKMQVYPEKHAPDLEEIIRTRKAKPFERRAHESIGAHSPFNPDKKVEALADSNIYMEFFVIAKYVNQGKIKLENLTDEFFDYVVLGKGDLEETAKASNLDNETIMEISQMMSQVYPVDLSVAGFEHKDVHLPFSLFTHAAVLSDKYFFPEYLITAHITANGEKMSKSKGNVIYLDDVLRTIEEKHTITSLSEEASFDILRFFLTYYQSLEKDFDWNHELFVSVGVNKVKRYVEQIRTAQNVAKKEEYSIYSQLDKWLLTANQLYVQEATKQMERRRFRNALITAVDLMSKDLKTYLDRSENPKLEIISEFIRTQLAITHSVMPRISNELHKQLFGEEVKEWPKVEVSKLFLEDYEKERHNQQKKDYLNEYVNGISREVGILRGKKELREGDTVEVYLPSDYTVQALSSHKIPSLKGLQYSFSVSEQFSENVRVVKK